MADEAEVEQAPTDEYDELEYHELQSRAKDRGLSARGTREELSEALREADASQTGPNGGTPGDVQPQQADSRVIGRGRRVVNQDAMSVTGDAHVGHLGPDGKPLPQKHPEPADVAGESGPGGADDPDNRMRAHYAREVADARYRKGDTPYTMPVERDDSYAERGEDGSVQTGEFIPGSVAEGGYTERTLPIVERRQHDLGQWVAGHPDATVIPPPLLPPIFNDPAVATPGLPSDYGLR